VQGEQVRLEIEKDFFIGLRPFLMMVESLVAVQFGVPGGKKINMGEEGDAVRLLQLDGVFNPLQSLLVKLLD
jgi:hypothetical protein